MAFSFSRRIATLAAVVAIPLGIAATSFALTDSPEAPKVPPKVELEKGASSPAPTPTSTRPSATPSDEVVPRPPVTDSPADDDDADDRGQDDADDGAGDDG
ncbi:small secreted hydrophilic protein [Streptomyces tailanensis]|uniref:small secreted hydrophilic protein n=1 Tax=Streptomyces tailanensis TaxID=2569858 RepID=UPI00122DEB5A|nr:small secreted hydrophilic protein [Streptomyces tailanensis]